MTLLAAVSLLSLVAMMLTRRFVPSHFVVLSIFIAGAFLIPVVLTSFYFPSALASTAIFGQLVGALVASVFGFFVALLVAHFASGMRPGLRVERRKHITFTEDAGQASWSVAIVLLLLSLIGVAASVRVHYLVAGVAPWQQTAYELNVAFSQFDASVGFIGRLARIGIPVGLYAFLKGVRTTSGPRRYVLLGVAAISLLSLLSVRRSPLLHLVFYAATALMIGARTRSQHRAALATIAALLAGSLAYFGSVQVATNKALDSTVIWSSLADGAIYIAGNIAYADCMSAREDGFEEGFSFPLQTYAIHALAGTPMPDMSKPFCGIGSVRIENDVKDVHFNTSPLYFDLVVDFGYAAMLLIFFGIGASIVVVGSGSAVSLGLLAMVTTAATLTFRENMFGQYDFITAIAVYFVLMLIDISPRYRRNNRRIHSTTRS